MNPDKIEHHIYGKNDWKTENIIGDFQNNLRRQFPEEISNFKTDNLF